MKKMIAAVLVAAMLACMLPTALAAKYSISFPGKVGMMYAGTSVTVKPKLKGVKSEWLTWETSNAAAASVSGGKINALTEGIAVISASCKNLSAAFGIIVLPRQINLDAGGVYQLPCAGIERYASQNPAIASVSASGMIAAVAAGTTYVGVRCKSQILGVQVNVTGGALPQSESKVSQLPCAAETSQIVLVEHQSGSKAKLSLHERQNGVWTQLFECDARVGRNGIGKKKEGDGKTPTGTFNLTTPFGIKDDPGAAMPYTKVTKYHYWCGSSGSDYYNQLVDMREIDRKCTSSDEYLINYGSAYNYCMFIDYNANGVSGKGSCIFLHCGSGSATAGCVSVPENVMVNILKWAQPGCKIVIQ